MQRSIDGRSGFLFLSVLERREKGDVALIAAQIFTNLRTPVWTPGMGDKRER